MITIIKEFKIEDSFLNERHIVYCMIKDTPFSVSYNADFMMSVNSVSKGHITETPLRPGEPETKVTPEMEITPEITELEIIDIILKRASLEEAYKVLSN